MLRLRQGEDGGDNNPEGLEMQEGLENVPGAEDVPAGDQSSQGDSEDTDQEKIMLRRPRPRNGPVWWDRRTKMEKGLLLFAFCCSITVIGLIAAVVIFSDSKRDSDVCNTLECLDTAAYVSTNMNPTIDPCVDFYQYACGGWIEQHHEPYRGTSNDQRALVDDQIETHMKELLSQRDHDALDSIKKARTYFRSCEDTDTIDAKNVVPFLDLLEAEGRNLFPTLEPTWEDQGYTLVQILARTMKVGGLGHSPLTPYTLAFDQKTQTYMLRFNKVKPSAVFPLLYDIMGDPTGDLMKQIKEFYVDLMTRLGAIEDTAVEDADDLISFEKRLVDAAKQAPIRDGAITVQRLTIEDLMQRHRHFDWLAHVQNIFSDVDVTITKETEVLVKGIHYYDVLLPMANTTSRRTLQNYCMWQLTLHFAKYLSYDVRRTLQLVHKNTGNFLFDVDRPTKCEGETVSQFPLATSRLYVDNYVSPVHKDIMMDMMGNMSAAFKDMLHEADWMSDANREAALKRVDDVVLQIAYPESILNTEFVNERTENWNITEDSYFNNVVFIQRLNHLNQLRRLVGSGHISGLSLIPMDTMPFYGAMGNTIGIPAGLLHRPWYSDKNLLALNYGGLGVTMGHLLVRAFENPADMVVKGRSWWLPEDLEKFTEREECVVRQYHDFTVPKSKEWMWSSINTRLIDVADNSGLKNAYRAYRKMIADRGREELKLPVLGFTPDQVFFIGSAQTYCAYGTNDTEISALGVNTESPWAFRVIGPLQNSPDFAKAFNCPEGSYMNPKDKCEVW